MAKQWANLPPMKTASADTGDKRNQFLIADRPESGRLIPTVLQLTLGPEVGFAEFVEVRLDGIFREFRDLRIELESPSGTVSVLGTPSEYPGSRDMDFIAEGIRWGSARHLGEDPTGVWTLKITDEVGGSNDRSGTIHGWSIKVYGHGEGQEPTPPKYTKVPDTPQTPTVVAIHDGIVDLEWNNVPETESYEVQFYDYGWLDLPGRGIEIALYGAGTVVRNLDPDGWYPFHVRAKNPLGTSDWSDIAYFQGTGSQDWNGVPEPTNSPATGAPTISGTPQVGEVLTASVEDIEDANGLNRVKFSYQWIRSNGSTDTDIEGATDAAYTLTDGDEGKTIKVRVSFTDRGGYAESLTSAATAAVTNNAPASNTPATGLPTISGMAQVGETLTAETRDIEDDDGLDNAVFTYQWLANGADIAGATDPTYTLVDDDAGLTIKVQVSFFDDKNNPETLTSVATTAVLANVPDTPEHLNVSLRDTGALDVSWEAPSTDGGSAITEYRVQWKETAGNWDTPADVSEETATGTTHTITGLTDGVEYAVRVIVANNVGEGPPSDEATGTPRETTPPELSTATVDGATLTLTYDEDLDENSEPSSDAFSVTVGGTGRAVDGVSVSGSSVILTLGSAVRAADTVTLSYTVPTDAAAPRIQDEAGNPAASFSDQDVENNTPPPANTPATGAPTITGTAQVGDTLAVETSAIDDADGLDNVGYSYQWLADDTDIAGATESTYTLVDDDAGLTIKVQVSFFDDENNQETLTSEATATVVTPLTAEFQDAPDKHLGTGVFTFVIAFSEPISIGYVTLRDDSLDVTNGSATKAKRVNGQSDRWEITVEPDSDAAVTVVLPITEDCESDGAVCTRDGTELSNRSELTVPGPAAANSPATGAPIISGTAQVGETLTVDTSGIDDADGIGNATFSYQWIAGTTDISGATGSSYAPLVADLGKTIKVRVSFDDDQNNFESLTSAATAAVAAKPNSPATGAPTISGTARVGETLTVDTSGIDDADGMSGAVFSYQWLANEVNIDTDIAGATDPTYTLVADEVGKAIRVRVSFDDDRNFLETLTSEATATVVTPLTAEFQDVPDKHDGTGFFTFDISISYKTLRDDSLDVTNGSATKAKRVDGQSDLWKITVEPDSDAAVTVVLPITEDCAAQDAVCTRDGTELSNRSELTVPGPAAANSPATGAPIISGTAEVGETLTVDTSGIDDADGMSGAVFSYQWLADGVDIAGATSDTYTLVDADFDTVKVRVHNEETWWMPNSASTGGPPRAIFGLRGLTKPTGFSPAMWD